MDSYAEGHAGQAQHVEDKLRSEVYEDKQLHRGSCQVKQNKSQHIVDAI